MLDGSLASKQAPTKFLIQARDMNNEPRTSGGDEFNVRIRNEEGVSVQSKILDNEDGTYTVSYAVPEPGDYVVSVEFMGTFGGQEGHIRGSPFKVKLVEGVPKTNNKMTGPLTMERVKNDIKYLQQYTKSTYSGLRAKVPESSIETQA